MCLQDSTSSLELFSRTIYLNPMYILSPRKIKGGKSAIGNVLITVCLQQYKQNITPPKDKDFHDSAFVYWGSTNSIASVKEKAKLAESRNHVLDTQQKKNLHCSRPMIKRLKQTNLAVPLVQDLMFIIITWGDKSWQQGRLDREWSPVYLAFPLLLLPLSPLWETLKEKYAKSSLTFSLRYEGIWSPRTHSWY